MGNPALLEPGLLTKLRCPECRAGGLRLVEEDEALTCQTCSTRYPISGSRPVLLRPSNTIFSANDYVCTTGEAPGSKFGFERLVPSPSVNLARNRVLSVLRHVLDSRGGCSILVVGGGHQRRWLTPLLQATRPHALIYTDVDSGADVDLFCDGHDLPFGDAVFDAVITTAVLEHVLYPERVAGEIARVLKLGGVVYSELPFMQQVHEGAYDFTRYTLSGHRHLFRRYLELESGMVAGPATALVWAIENFVLAFLAGGLSRTIAKAIVRLLLAWIKYFDHLLATRPQAMDGASCTYFLGTKAENVVGDAEIIRRYVGAKHLRHV